MLVGDSTRMSEKSDNARRLGWKRKPQWLAVIGSTFLIAIVLFVISPPTLEQRTIPRKTSTGTNATRLDSNHRHLGEETHNKRKQLKILYTVTTLAEYDKGNRATTKGFDRMSNSMIPVLKENVESLLAAGYHVDVFIISFYDMTRQHLIRQALPPQVKISIWDNAAPYTYQVDKMDDPKRKVFPNTLHLARQHRFVVKDNLFMYDFFLNFEDDMVIKAEHVQNHLELTQKLYQLREDAPETVDRNQLKNYHGALTKDQLKRMFPGLIRVEVLLDEKKYGTQTELDPVPVTHHPDIDPRPCCHMSNVSVSDSRPKDPASEKLFLWETGIQALGVRKMPDDQWVVFQRGPTSGRHMSNDYWSGKDGYFGGEHRPHGGNFGFINNQGGWMATRQQIWEWHSEICPGGFLPSFEPPHFNYDGLDLRNVEYWSGGLSLVTSRHACNLQRIVSLDPNRFARHLMYVIRSFWICQQ